MVKYLSHSLAWHRSHEVVLHSPASRLPSSCFLLIKIPLALKEMLDQAREAIKPAPDTRNSQQAHIHIRLVQQQGHQPQDAKHATDVLRVGHDSEGKTLVPRDRLAEPYSVVDPFFSQGIVHPHVQGLPCAEHNDAHDRLQGGDALRLEGR